MIVGELEAEPPLDVGELRVREPRTDLDRVESRQKPSRLQSQRPAFETV